MQDTGLLFVVCEIGPFASEEEVTDWYDNEHAPLRLTVPGITNAYRYKATDGKSPTWLAIYDASTPSVMQSEAYKQLAVQSSDREREIIPRLSTLNRRVYEFWSIKSADTPKIPAQYLFVVTMLVPPSLEDEFNKWYEEEHIPMLAKLGGWQLSKRYKLVSSYELGRGAGEDAAKPEHNYLAIHEFDHDGYMGLPGFKETIQTPWAQKVLPRVTDSSVRRFGLHKSFEKQ